MLTYPRSASGATWLARLDPSAPAPVRSPRGATRARLLLADSQTGKETAHSVYLQRLTDVRRLTSGRTFFLATKVGPYKADGDSFTLADYSASSSALPGQSLNTYSQGASALAAGKTGQAAFTALAADVVLARSRKGGDVSGAAETPIGVPYSWTPAPMPHWAMYGYDLATRAGMGLPEILQPGYLRIGAISFQHTVGPIDLQIGQSAQVQTLPSLRQNQSQKRISGNIRKTVEFTLQFPDARAVSEELAPFLRQCRLAPFVPVINREMYEAGIDALALEAVTVSTVPGFPEMLQASVRASQMNWRRYLLDAPEFDLCFNYPLLELWLASAAVPGIPGPVELSLPWDSSLRCYVPSRDWLSLVNDNATSADAVASSSAFADPADPRVNLLYKAVMAVESGDSSAVPVYKEGDKLVQPVVIRGAYDDRKLLGIPLTSHDLFLTALGPKSADGADYIILSPKTMSDGTLDTSAGELQDGSGDSPRSLMAANVAAGAFEPGYWGFWDLGRRLALPHPPNPLESSLGVAAEATLLSPSNPFFLAVPEFEGLVLTNITAQMSNVLAEFSPEDEETPVFQHLGTADTTLVFEGQCPEDTARLLEDFVREVAQLAVDFRGQWDGSAYGGYCRIDNEVARVCGFQGAIPVALTVDTIPNFPSERRISLSLVSFDPGQHRRNVPQFVGTTGTQAPTLDRPPGTADSAATQDYNDQTSHSEQSDILEMFVQGMELYPDLALPTWKQLSRWAGDLPHIWDYDKNVPSPGYEFLRTWPYPKSYWPTAENEGYRISLLEDDQVGKGHVSYEFDPASGRSVKQEAGAGVPDANRAGYADPDFYCASRGDRRRPTGADRVEIVLQSLLGSNGAAETKSLYHGSDGAKFTSSFGDKEAGMVPDAASVLAMAAHINGNFPGGDTTQERLIHGVPESAKPTDLSKPSVTPGTLTPSSVTSGGGFTADKAYGGAFLPQIRQASSQYGVPIPLIQATINAESSGDQRCITHDSAGAAYGIMQSYYKNSEPVPADLKAGMVAAGLKYGCQEMRSCLNAAGGDVRTAILIYRAGVAGAKHASAGKLKYQQKVYADFQRISASAPAVPVTNAASKVSVGATTNGPHGVTDGSAMVKDIGKGFSGFGSDILKGASGFGSDILKGTQGFGSDILKGASGFGSDIIKGTHGFGSEIIKGTHGFGSEIAKGASDSVAALGIGIRRTFFGEGTAPEENFQAADLRSWDVDRACYDPHYGEDVFYALRRGEQSGRLKQAFPSYLVLLVDGGPIFRVWRLSDVFYGLHSALSIEVFSSRKIAGDTAVVSFADPYNNLSSVAADVALAKQSDTRTIFGVQATFDAIGSVFYPTQEVQARREEDLRSLMVKAGARLHIRLGYGSDGSQMPIVFNGQVSGVRRRSDVLEVTALGDGAELTNELSPNSSDQGAYVRSGTGGSGENLRNIILDFFTATEADRLSQELGGALGGVVENATRLTDGFFLGGNPWGITHFGSPNRGGQITDAGECGPNIYSGWSESPVNVTYATEDWPIITNLLPGIYQAANEDIPQALRAAAASFLGLADSDGYAKSMDEAGLFRRFSGEPIVGLSMEGATPWDIISTLRYVATDYIRIVEPFGLRSTLFFGKNYWPLHYRYDSKTIADLRAKLGKSYGSVGDFVMGTPKARADMATSSQFGQRGHSPLDDYEVVYRRRPYLQVHTAHSGSNLLASEVEATDEGWCSIVQSLGATTGFSASDKTESSYAQFLDVDIFPEFQRQKVVRSGLYSAQTMRAADAGYTLGTSTPFLSTNVLNNHAVGVLHDEVRDMYQGDIVIAGNAWVRPFHLVHLNDEMKKMQGLVEVGEVLHSLTPDGGYVTTIKPDCLAAAADPSMSLLWGHCLAACGRILIGNQILRLVTTAGGRHLVRRAVAQSLRVVDAVDERFGHAVGGKLKSGEYALSSTFRRKWRTTKASRYGARVQRRVQDFGHDVYGVRIKASGKDAPLKQEILDEFDRQLRVRGTHEDLTRRIHGRRISQKTYESIHGDLTERLYLDKTAFIAEATNLEEEAARNLERKELLTRIKNAVDGALGKFNPVDKSGNLIEEDRLLSKVTNWVDPYHGEGSLGLDLREAFRQRRALQWGASTPAGRARLDPEVLAAVHEFSAFGNEKELTVLLDKLGLSAQDREAQHIASAFRGASAEAKTGAGLLAKELDKKIADQEASLAALTEGQKKASGAARRKLTSRIYLEQRKLGNLRAIRARSLALSEGEDAARAADSLGRRVLAEERAGRIVQSVLAVYGRYVPAADLAALHGKSIAGLGKGANKAAELAAKLRGARAAAQTAKGLEVGLAFLGGGKLALLKAAAKAAASLTTMGGLTLLDRYLQSRHALFVTPLRSCGREFSAGLTGHRGACVGDHLGPMDGFIAYFADDQSSQPILHILTSMLGLSVHYTQDPAQYQELLSGLGIRVDDTPVQSSTRYASQLAHMQALNALGFNLDARVFESAPGFASANGALVLKDRTGKIADAYRNVVQRLSADTNIAQTQGLINTDAEATRWCARAVKEVLVAAGVFKSYPNSGNAIALGQYVRELKDTFESFGPTILSQVPDGALCFWDNASGGSGHTAFKMTDGQGIYLLGNTEGQLKYRSVGGKFTSVTSYALPVSGPPAASPVSKPAPPTPPATPHPAPKPARPAPPAARPVSKPALPAPPAAPSQSIPKRQA